MRICIVARVVPQHGIGGMQDHTRDLAHGLVRAGHEVEIVTSRHPEGRHEERIEGVRYVFVDAPGVLNHPQWLRASYAAFAELHRERPYDVLHSESTSAVEHVRRGVHRTMPVVVKFHGNFLSLAKAQLRSGAHARGPVPMLRAVRSVQHLAVHGHFRRGGWYRFRACEAMVPSRQELRDTCRSHLLKRSRVHVVPNGVDTGVFRPQPAADVRAELGLAGDPLFVCVGRLSRDKGIHHAVRAVAELRADAPDMRLAVVGDGEERGRLEALARELGLGGRVVFTGAQPSGRVALYLSAADVFLFPTERAEAAPLVLPQAMACQRAVIASRIGGIPEVVGERGECGLLVRPGDLGALVEAMRTLIADEPLRGRLGQAARRRVLGEYTVERMVDRTVGVYQIAAKRLAVER